jgi:hypothetical protein
MWRLRKLMPVNDAPMLDDFGVPHPFMDLLNAKLLTFLINARLMLPS